MTVQALDFLAVCTCTGYVCPYFGMTDAELCFSRAVLRNFGNMSSPTVMFVLDEIVRNGDPHSGDLGIMIALGPGMAAKVVLLRW